MKKLPDWQAMTNAEKDAIIEPLWLEGKSAGEIMAYFANATRNMIIGRINRGKLRGKRPPRPTKPKVFKPREPRPPKPPKTVKPRKPVIITEFKTIAHPNPVPQSVLDMINTDRPPLAGTVPVSIFALPMRDVGVCRFPVTGGYCGIKCGDQVYCPTHRRIAYKPVETKMRVPKEARL